MGPKSSTPSPSPKSHEKNCGLTATVTEAKKCSSPSCRRDRLSPKRSIIKMCIRDSRCYDLLSQQKGLIFFQNPEIGRNAQLVKIFTDKLAAKAMDSTDMGSVQKNLLALQMNVVRLLLQQGADLPGYPRLHLGGSSLCKGDHQRCV